MVPCILHRCLWWQSFICTVLRGGDMACIPYFAGWISLGEDSRDSIAAFLFTWRDGDLTQRPIKLAKVGLEPKVLPTYRMPGCQT